MQVEVHGLVILHVARRQRRVVAKLLEQVEHVGQTKQRCVLLDEIALRLFSCRNLAGDILFL